MLPQLRPAQRTIEQWPCKCCSNIGMATSMKRVSIHSSHYIRVLPGTVQIHSIIHLYRLSVLLPVSAHWEGLSRRESRLRQLNCEPKRTEQDGFHEYLDRFRSRRMRSVAAVHRNLCRSQLCQSCLCLLRQSGFAVEEYRCLYLLTRQRT